MTQAKELWSALFGKAMELAPMLVLARYVYNGTLTLGVYMQTLSAFHSVQEGLSSAISRWIEINRFLAVYKRLREFEDALPPPAARAAAADTVRMMTSAQGRSPRSWWFSADKQKAVAP